MLHSLHGCSHGWYISTPVFDYKWQQLQSNMNMFNLEISTCWKTTSKQRMLFMQSIVNESIMCCLRQNLQTTWSFKRATSIKWISVTWTYHVFLTSWRKPYLKTTQHIAPCSLSLMQGTCKDNRRKNKRRQSYYFKVCRLYMYFYWNKSCDDHLCI